MQVRRAQLTGGGDGRHGDLEVSVGQVKNHHAIGLEQLQIALDRLDRQQVGRHGVGREGVDDQQIVGARRLLGHRQARVAEDGADRAVGAVRDIAEPGRVARHAIHHGVDLEEGHLVFGALVGGHGARALTHHADPGGRRARLNALRRLTQRRGGGVVHGRAAGEAGRAGLGAVQGGAVHQDVDIAAHAVVARDGHAHDAEEAALGQVPVIAASDMVSGQSDDGDDGGEQDRAVPDQKGADRRAAQNELHHLQPRLIAEQGPEVGIVAHELQNDRRGGGDADADQQDDDLAARQGPFAPRPRQTDQHHDQRVFPDAVEDDGGDQGVERPADHTAQRQQKVELGQAIRRGPSRGQPLMTHQGGEEEGRQMPQQQQQPLTGVHAHQADHDGAQRGLKHERRRQADPRLRLEGDDEGQQIEGQGRDPEERGRGHVGRKVSGDAQHEAGRGGGQQNQYALFAPGDGRADGQRRGLWRVLNATTPDHDSQSDHQNDEQAVAAGPAVSLARQRHQRLNQGRVGEQSQETAEVGGGIEDIGVLAIGMVGANPRIPGLKQRRRGREDRERRTDRQGQRGQQPGGGCGGIRLAQQAADLERQEEGRREQQGQMNGGLPLQRANPLQQVGVAVADQQRRLEEDHRGVPHRRRSAQHGQDQLRDHGLDDKNQRRRREDGDGEQRGCYRIGLAKGRRHGGIGHSRSAGIGLVV
ncbi:hypothetical protein D3C85_360960 [compost metagenome]